MTSLKSIMAWAQSLCLQPSVPALTTPASEKVREQAGYGGGSERLPDAILKGIKDPESYCPNSTLSFLHPVAGALSRTSHLADFIAHSQMRSKRELPKKMLHFITRPAHVCFCTNHKIPTDPSTVYLKEFQMTGRKQKLQSHQKCKQTSHHHVICMR